jgi:NitT/TauT family transport system substrate-binding protein
MQPASDKVRTVALLKRGALVLLTLGAAALALHAFRTHDNGAAPLRPLTIAVPAQINSAPMLVASAQGLFQQAGVSVTSQAFELGKDALKSLLDGRADLAVVADTPLMFALLDGADIAMLAGISQARATLAIVTRNDRGIANMQDLRGKSIGVTLGTNFPYFLDAMLQVHGVPSEQVTLADLRTDEISSAFKTGRVDAAVVYHPYLARLKGEMGERIKVFYGEDVYAFRFILVGKPAYIDSHPQEIQRVLSALLAANRAIRADPVAARRAVGAALKIDDATMAEVFDPEDYTVSLDQAMLLALDDQTRWAMQKGLVRTRPMPNYLHAMKYQNLEAVLPSAVTIVH